jgi:hypothetical protein
VIKGPVSVLFLFAISQSASLTVAVPSAFAQDTNRTGTTTQDRLRWELITDGTTPVGSGPDSTTESPIPNVTGTNATFLFRLDAQPLLNYASSTTAQANAKKSLHLNFESGIISVGRAVTARAETELSAAAQAIRNQGGTVTDTTESAPTLSRQRAFTVGSEFSANRLIDADGGGAFAEIGVIGKTHFDAFLQDQQFFEKDGITYVKLAQPSGNQAGFFRGEFGVRFRISQFDEETRIRDSELKGKNISDLLLFEFLVQRSGALKGLVVDSTSHTANRWVMRFLATPYLNPKNGDSVKRTKFLLGVEVNDDLGSHSQDVQIFYGVNVDLRSLLSRQ